MPKRLDIVLRSDYSPEVCAERLAAQIDFPHRTILSFSGYRGEKAILGRTLGPEFSLFKRRYYRNDFAPVLYGLLIPEGSGTRIEGYWGMQPSATFFRRIWFVLVVVLGMPVFFIYAKCAVFQTCPGKSDQWAGLLVPLGLLFLGLLVPRLGAALGLPERRPVVVLVEQVLVAGRGATEMPERAWKSSLDRI